MYVILEVDQSHSWCEELGPRVYFLCCFDLNVVIVAVISRW